MSGRFDENAGSQLSMGAIQPTGGRARYDFLEPPQSSDELGRVGEYRVKRVLGIGGMGIVFLAEDASLNRKVALKFLRPELAGQGANRERFLREARSAAAAGVHSDYIVPVLHIGVVRDVPYFVTPLLAGETLQDRLDRTQRLELRPALIVARDVALGLAAAHSAGLVHRDIKPANIWLESERPGGPFRRVKLLDFGLARHAEGETSLTASGMIVGTPDYMAPEQVEGLKVDHRADLFSLGAVLYTALSGEQPFKGRSAMAVLLAVTSRSVDSISTKVPEVPDAVERLVARLLEKEPANRPGSAMEVVETIDGVLAGLAPTTPAPLAPNQRETPAPSAHLTVATVKRPRGPSRRTWLRRAGAAAAAGACAWGAYALFRGRTGEPIRVGVLHSRTGTMAISELPVADATLLALSEINAAGGVAGRPLEAVVVDGQSKPDEFSRQADHLLDEKVPVIFGCWTSASRRAVREVLQRRDQSLLFYPVQYEGLGDSPRIFYFGPAPNQQLVPGVEFLVRPNGSGGLGRKRLYLVGSDYLFPRVAHQIIRDLVRLNMQGVEIVGESFVPLGADSLAAIVESIRAKAPDAIINTLNGGSNASFFRELRRAGFTPARVPTLSLSITESEVMGLNPATMAGDYLAASYFQTLDRAESREFLRRLRSRYGEAYVATDPMAAAYSAVHVWVKAVERVGTTDPITVRDALHGLEFEDIRGRIRIDAETQHCWLPAHIGRIRHDGLVDLVPGAGSETPIRPVPFPPSRTHEEWHQYLRSLQFEWNGKWQPE